MPPRLAALGWTACALAAAWVDAGAPAAALWVSRCASADLGSAVATALRLDEHMRAFPLTMAAMALRCALPHAHRPGHVVRAGVSMLLWMPLACLAGASLAGGVPSAWQPLSYALAMLAIGAMPPLRWARPTAAVLRPGRAARVTRW